MRATILSALLSASLVSAQTAAPAANLQGFSADGLAALNKAMHDWVDQKKGANVVTLLARKGQVVNFDAYGAMDAGAKTQVPVKKDSIFKIMSMTKPTVGVAMMMMYEAGKWKFDDPITKFIPEFASLKVKGAGGALEPVKKPITMGMIVSHSAGFDTQLTVASDTLGEIVPPLVKGNLAFQPGRDWRYGPGVEIQGYLVEKWANEDLSDFMSKRIFKPLNMTDTGFFIDAAKASRVPKLHSSALGGLSALPNSPATSKPKRIFPSGGLLSTAEDYFKFSQMLLNNGTLNGVQILKPETVQLMHTNLLEPDVGVKFSGKDGKGLGFGVDFAIVLDRALSKNNQPEGAYYWGGAYGTWFWIDPKNDIVFVGMIQNIGSGLSGEGSLRDVSAQLTYKALQK